MQSAFAEAQPVPAVNKAASPKDQTTPAYILSVPYEKHRHSKRHFKLTQLSQV